MRYTGNKQGSFINRSQFILTLFLYALAPQAITQEFDNKSTSTDGSNSGFYLADVSSLFGQSLYEELGIRIYENGLNIRHTILLKETKSRRSNIFELHIGDEVLARFSIALRKLNTNSEVTSFATSLHSRLSTEANK